MNRTRTRLFSMRKVLVALLAVAAPVSAFAARAPVFFEKHCFDCHDAESRKGNLDLTSLKTDFADVDTFRRWVKIYDRIRTGEMPPKKVTDRPTAGELEGVTCWLLAILTQADKARLDAEGRTGIRRLTRAEYENTIRDLFDMPGIALQGMLPADGSAHGFDKNYEALDISHVNMAKYDEAADAALDMAIATQPKPPTRK